MCFFRKTPETAQCYCFYVLYKTDQTSDAFCSVMYLCAVNFVQITLLDFALCFTIYEWFVQMLNGWMIQNLV